MCLSINGGPEVAWRNLIRSKEHKSTQNGIPLDLFVKHKMEPSQEVQPPKVEWQKKINIWTPPTKLLPINPTNLDLTNSKYSMLGGLHALMYTRNWVIAYSPGLHISKAIEIKIVVDRVCPHLPIWDVAKKKDFKLYHYAEMPSR